MYVLKMSSKLLMVKLGHLKYSVKNKAAIKEVKFLQLIVFTENIFLPVIADYIMIMASNSLNIVCAAELTINNI